MGGLKAAVALVRGLGMGQQHWDKLIQDPVAQDGCCLSPCGAAEEGKGEPEGGGICIFST